MTPLRVGVWFDVSHLAYGGPTAVLVGTLLGFKQLREDIVVLLNEPGDVNWSLDGKDLRDVGPRAPNLVAGPMVLTLDDGERDEYAENPTWKHGAGATVVVPTDWVRTFISRAMPYGKPEGGGRRLALWPAGVDTRFFAPAPVPVKTQDFFIYYKSQRHADLHRIHSMLFKSHFHLRGSVLAYYCYTPEMLRAAARASRFCIVLDSTETQGLAMLEIMATGCPLFVVDCTTYKGNRMAMTGASSCPCWSPKCGVKTSWETLESDFASFLPTVSSYTPRAFVESSYSWESAAASLLSLATTSGESKGAQS